MCVDRVHRFLMATVLGIGAFLIHQSSPWGEVVLWFVIGMLLVYGLTNFCPSVWIMKQLGLKSCSAK